MQTVKIKVTPCDGNEAGEVLINAEDVTPEMVLCPGYALPVPEGGEPVQLTATVAETSAPADVVTEAASGDATAETTTPTRGTKKKGA
jgi:hypothetical protein